MPRPDAANIQAALPAELARERTRRARVRTPVVSVALSAVIHALLIFAAATIGWRIAARPNTLPGVKVSFDAPGDAGFAASPAAPVPAAQSKDPPLSQATIEPAAPIAPQPQARTELTGLSSETPSPPHTTAVDTVAQTSLVSASLFSSEAAPAPESRGAIAGVDASAPSSPSVTFAGLGASSASSVVYAVDCSGPMVTSLPLVIAELERSVSRLSPAQKFGVVLFKRTTDNGPGAESFAPVLVRATPSARQLLHAWLAAAEPAGRSSPLAGIETALALHPDAVFLLSHAIARSGGGEWGLGMEHTMARLEELNAPPAGQGRPVLIQTIQFLDEDPTGIMQAIGQRFGGGSGYRVVKHQQDLGTGAAPPSPGATNH